MDREEIAAVVDQVLAELNLSAPTAKEKGLIMKTLMPRVKGKADSALVNQVLSMLGVQTIPIADEDVNTLIATGWTIAASLAAWWKNNSFTPEAIEADAFMARMKKRVR